MVFIPFSFGVNGLVENGGGTSFIHWLYPGEKTFFQADMGIGIGSQRPTRFEDMSAFDKGHFRVQPMKCCGGYDQIIPFQLASNTQAALSSLGYQSELKKYEMEHSVCIEEVDAISDWMNKCFAD